MFFSRYLRNNVFIIYIFIHLNLNNVFLFKVAFPEKNILSPPSPSTVTISDLLPEFKPLIYLIPLSTWLRLNILSALFSIFVFCSSYCLILFSVQFYCYYWLSNLYIFCHGSCVYKMRKKHISSEHNINKRLIVLSKFDLLIRTVSFVNHPDLFWERFVEYSCITTLLRKSHLPWSAYFHKLQISAATNTHYT